tara:strand:+ start:132 stop:1076 length:945 start_codon:yes stop_codon:yes gene_type:complete
MRVLITGGDGFIGKNLAQSLLNRGDNVHVLDNHVTSHPILNHESLTRTTGDVCDVFDLISEDKGPDVIVHLASVAIPKLYMKEPDFVIRPNVIGTNEVCKLAEKYGSRVIFASTSEVYGSTIDGVSVGTSLSENSFSLSSLLSPRTPYSVSKKMGEEIVHSFIRKGNSGCSVRFFNVIGPNMDKAVLGYGRVIPNFVDSIVQNKSLTIYGDGHQTRCFLWINDAVSALLKLIDFKKDIPSVINIGHSQQTSILDLAHLFNEIAGVQNDVEFLEKLPDEPKHRRPNISLAKSMLDWEPTIDLYDIVSKILTEAVE